MNDSKNGISEPFTESVEGVGNEVEANSQTEHVQPKKQESPSPELKPRWARGKTQQQDNNLRFIIQQEKENQERKNERLKDKFQRRRRM